MSVYMIIEIEVKNAKRYAEYVEKVPEVIVKYGGRYLARGGQIIPLAGNWNPERIILIKFETIEQLRKCFSSKEYREIAPLRGQSAIGRSIVVDGCPPTP